MTLEVAWEGGGRARVTSLQGEDMTLRSTRPFAPGSRPNGTLDGGLALRLKTHRCRRDESPADGMTFTVDGRILDATRATRERVAAGLRDASITADGDVPAGEAEGEPGAGA